MTLTLVVLSVVVSTFPDRIGTIDVGVADAIAAWNPLKAISVLSGLGSATVILVLAVAAVAIGYRCVVYSVLYVGAVAVVFAAGYLLEVLVERGRPLGIVLTGQPSFPSTPIAHLVVLAGLVPLGIATLTERRRLGVVAGIILAVLPITVGLIEVQQRQRWPTDVMGGALLGGAVVLAARSAFKHPVGHRLCRHPAHRDRAAGLLALPEHFTVALTRGVAVWTSLLALAFVTYVLRSHPKSGADGAIVASDDAALAQITLATLVMVGGLASLRWRVIGATVIAVGGVGLALMSATENERTVAIVITVAACLPAFAVWMSWQVSASGPRIWTVAFAATGLLTVGFLGAHGLYERHYGATHPTSPLGLLPIEGVEWAWSGGLNPTGGTVVARLDYGEHRAHLRVAPMGNGRTVSSSNVTAPESRIVRLHADGLEPGTKYRWTVVVDGTPDRTRGTGRFRTPALGAESFTVAVGACARTGSDGRVWDAMHAIAPDLVVMTGDLHYQNISDDAVDAYLHAYDRVLTQPAPARLFRDAPVAYLWDDHDYGINDADGTSPSRPAARASYEISVPHGRPGPSGAPAQAFTIGRVRFIVTDERSHRSAHTMLGRRQLSWFLHELVTASRTHALVVWVNSVPWIGAAGSNNEWPHYPAERRRIANTIAAADIHNLVMLAGDAHMVAIDDGRHSGYAPHGQGGFPVLQAGALDRPGEVKGGPYSEGVHPGGGQFGVLRVTDQGGAVKVELQGRNWRGNTLTRYSFTVANDSLRTAARGARTSP